MAKIRIVLADDHAVLRSGLRLLIHTQPDMEVVGEAGDFGETLRVCEQLQPDVVTLDLNMPGGTAGRTITEILHVCPEAHVLVLTMHDDPAYLRAALAAGAQGYVVKKAADTELLSALRAVAQGRAFVDVDIAKGQPADVLVQPEGKPGAAATPLESLSQREHEVLKLVAEGYTNQTIADKLFLSVKTVESYRARLMSKLGLRSRADLTRFALDVGILTSDGKVTTDNSES